MGFARGVREKRVMLFGQPRVKGEAKEKRRKVAFRLGYTQYRHEYAYLFAMQYFEVVYSCPILIP